jgi:hypothetical protein
MSSQNSQITKPTQNSPLEGYDRRSGGGLFDIIVGNPPWGADIDKYSEYFAKTYPNSTKNHKDIYKIFIDKALQLLNDGGRLGFVVPNTFLFQPRYADLKEILNQYDWYVVNLGEKIFPEVELPCCMLFVHKVPAYRKPLVVDLTKVERSKLPETLKNLNLNEERKKQESENNFLEKITQTELTFDNVFLMKDAGINYQAVNVGKTEKGQSNLSSLLLYDGNCENPSFDVNFWKGENIDKYHIDEKTDHFVRTNYQDFKAENERVILNKEYFEIAPKLIWRQTASRILATIDTKGVWFGRSILSAILRDEYKGKVDYRYALAIFNSELINSVYQSKVKELGKVFPQVKLTYLRDLPFVIATPAEQAQIAELVDRIMELKKESQKLTDSFVKLIQAKYFRNIKSTNGDTVVASTTGNFKISTKLKHWHKLETYDFLDEVNKAIKKFVAEAPSLHGKLSSGKQEFDCGFGKQGLSSTKQKLSLSQEAELMAYFDEQKVKALELEMEVKRVDNLIENGVRDLYKL